MRPPAQEAKIDGGPNVQRKVNVGACMPLYTAPGVDITDEVLAILNSAK